MGVLGREEYFNRIQTMVGEDSSDEAISFIEDMTDTFNDLESRAAGDGVDWEGRYHELDERWKRKYRHRFFSGSGNSAPAPDEEETDEGTTNPDDMTVEDLFEEVPASERQTS